MSSSHSRVTSIKFAKRYGVSESVSQLLTSIAKNHLVYLTMMMSISTMMTTVFLRKLEVVHKQVAASVALNGPNHE